MADKQAKSEPKPSVRRQLNAVDKQVRALELRKAGKTLEQIANELGYASKSGAAKALSVALQKTIQEPADELRTLESQRLDALLHSLWPNALSGDTRAIDTCLRVMDRRAKLLGLDAPAKLEHTGEDGGPLNITITRVTKAVAV